MSEPKNRLLFWNAVIAGLLVAANLFVANVIASKMDVRWDLTEDKRFEIGESSAKILSKVEGTVSVKCYFSANVPKAYNHVERVVAEKLSEYEELSSGKVLYEIVDPGGIGSEEALQELKDMNIAAVPLEEREGASRRKVVSSFLTMVFRYGDRKSVVNLFQDLAATLRDPGAFASQLEYVTTQAIRNVTTERRTIGVLAKIELVPQDRANPNSEKRKYQNLSLLKSWISRSHDVVFIDPVAINRGDPIPQEIDVVVCYQPRDISGAGLFILDQYLMAGGDMAFFMDQGEVSYNGRTKMTPIGNTQMRDFDMPTYEAIPYEHNLTEFLAHFGVRLGRSFVEDMSNFTMPFARSKEVASNGRQYYVKPIYEYAPYPSWVMIPARNEEGQPISDKQIGQDWPLLAQSDDLLLTWASPLELDKDSLTKNNSTADVILRTGPQSWSRALKETVFSPVPEEWTEPTAKQENIVAALIRGEFRSFFDGQEAPKVKAPNGLEVAWSEDFLKGRRDRVTEPGKIFVMGDADFIGDHMLKQVIGIYQQRKKSRAQDPEAMKIVYSAVRFASNALDVLCYGEDSKSMFRLLNREVKSRELKKIEEGDELMTKILSVNLYIVPGLTILACFGMVFWRRMKTGAVSV
ncbi:MAG: ABC-type uncharacterized transport system involved in gliding motility auxiliary subunit [Planctomycetota bacterium]|jgi:ABC-type uncharacterized transport system involved in gliding motility auxiliary subunit